MNGSLYLNFGLLFDEAEKDLSVFKRSGMINFSSLP